MEAKGKDMSSKEAYSTAQVTVSELDRQAPDGSEDQAHHHVDGEPMLGRKLSSLGATALGYTTLATWVAYSASSATALASGGANVLVALISVPTLLLAVSYSIVAYVCLVARWKAGQNERGASSTEKASQSQDGRTSEGSESDSVWDPRFKMGAWLTVSSNVVTIVFTVLLCVFLPPPSPPLSPCSSAQPTSPPWLARFLWPSATFPAMPGWLLALRFAYIPPTLPHSSLLRRA
ncbi:related to HNM1-choline permease [Sporisorium reilianum f. sp. reilianum]|uniref:Related to HNM1-choline permease n=1 Tax=Sporisorium reilianum f. sp. reilianum TaxID=72559 RepID=A0A2N8UFW4_9BASI|nr:related to HNM1-choline permease [Sporisorium reilianum f. sp. reilianum]